MPYNRQPNYYPPTYPDRDLTYRPDPAMYAKNEGRNIAGTGAAIGTAVTSAGVGLGLMTAGIDPFTMGYKGWQAGSLLGTGMGIKAAATGAALGMLPTLALTGAVDFYGKNFAGGIQDASMMSNIMGSSFSHINASGGKGFSKGDVRSIGKFMENMASISELHTSFEELTKLIPKLKQSGMLTAFNPSEFKKSFSDIVSHLKTVAEVAGTTLHGASDLMIQSRKLGFYTAADITGNVINRQVTSGITGLNPNDITRGMQRGTQLSLGYGGMMSSGAKGVGHYTQVISTMEKMGMVSKGDIAEMTGGGNEVDLATKMYQAGLNFSRSTPGKYLMTALGAVDENGSYTGGMDASLVEAWRNGELSKSDIAALNRRKTGTHAGQLSYTRLKRKLGSEFAANFGPGSISRLVGGMGSEERKYVIQTMSGGNADFANFLNMAANNSGAIDDATRLDIRRQLELSAEKSIGKQYGLHGMWDKFKKDLADAMGGPEARKAGQAVEASISDAIDEMSEWASGRIKIRISSEGMAAGKELLRHGGIGRVHSDLLRAKYADEMGRGKGADYYTGMGISSGDIQQGGFFSRGGSNLLFGLGSLNPMKAYRGLEDLTKGTYIAGVEGVRAIGNFIHDLPQMGKNTAGDAARAKLMAAAGYHLASEGRVGLTGLASGYASGDKFLSGAAAARRLSQQQNGVISPEGMRTLAEGYINGGSDEQNASFRAALLGLSDKDFVRLHSNERNKVLEEVVKKTGGKGVKAIGAAFKMAEKLHMVKSTNLNNSSLLSMGSDKLAQYLGKMQDKAYAGLSSATKAVLSGKGADTRAAFDYLNGKLDRNDKRFRMLPIEVQTDLVKKKSSGDNGKGILNVQASASVLELTNAMGLQGEYLNTQYTGDNSTINEYIMAMSKGDYSIAEGDFKKVENIVDNMPKGKEKARLEKLFGITTKNRIVKRWSDKNNKDIKLLNKYIAEGDADKASRLAAKLGIDSTYYDIGTADKISPDEAAAIGEQKGTEAAMFSGADKKSSTDVGAAGAAVQKKAFDNWVQFTKQTDEAVRLLTSDVEDIKKKM